MANILFLTRQMEVARSICEQFVLAGHQVEVAYSLEIAQGLLSEMSVNVLVLDSLFCGEEEGIDFVLKAKSALPRLFIILSVGTEDQAIVYELLSVGIISTWIKDAFQNKDLLSIVENILCKYRTTTHPESFLELGKQTPAERRGFLRKEVGVSVRWHSAGEVSSAHVPWAISQAKNVSLKGLMFETDRKLDVHQHIRLEICLSPNEVPIQAAGQVRWTRVDAPPNPQQCGIQFVDLEEQDRVKFLDYLSA